MLAPFKLRSNSVNLATVTWVIQESISSTVVIFQNLLSSKISEANTFMSTQDMTKHSYIKIIKINSWVFFKETDNNKPANILSESIYSTHKNSRFLVYIAHCGKLSCGFVSAFVAKTIQKTMNKGPRNKCAKKTQTLVTVTINSSQHAPYSHKTSRTTVSPESSAPHWQPF